ncbi:MAG TPA: LysM peptidoglycan-binding domain-containing protein [Clostridia bacterium]|nr:LysM peptidoglycan-binding domain-containing protein [Clostridia bacterium]
MNRKFRLVNRRRFYIFIMIVTVAVTSMAFAATVQGADTGESYQTVVVEQGDTLWDIAREYNNGHDLRGYITELKKMNGMDSSNIFAGDVLKMPV